MQTTSQALTNTRNRLLGAVSGDLPMPGPSAMADVVRDLDRAIMDLSTYEAGHAPAASEAALIRWWRSLAADEQAGAIALMDAVTAAIAAGDYAVMDIIATLAPGPALDVTPADVIPVIDLAAAQRRAPPVVSCPSPGQAHAHASAIRAGDYDAAPAGATP